MSGNLSNRISAQSTHSTYSIDSYYQGKSTNSADSGSSSPTNRTTTASTSTHPQNSQTLSKLPSRPASTETITRRPSSSALPATMSPVIVNPFATPMTQSQTSLNELPYLPARQRANTHYRSSNQQANTGASSTSIELNEIFSNSAVSASSPALTALADSVADNLSGHNFGQMTTTDILNLTPSQLEAAILETGGNPQEISNHLSSLQRALRNIEGMPSSAQDQTAAARIYSQLKEYVQGNPVLSALLASVGFLGAVGGTVSLVDFILKKLSPPPAASENSN